MSTKGFAIKCEGAADCTRKLRALADLSGIIERECAGRIQDTMRRTAVDKLTGEDAVDTGVLRASVETDDGYNSFTERPSEGTVSVGIRTDVSYAMFIEYGTGPKGDPEVPHTEKPFWIYPTGRIDPVTGKPEFKVAVSQPARPFMRPALYDNQDEFRRIITKAIKGATK